MPINRRQWLPSVPIRWRTHNSLSEISSVRDSKPFAELDQERLTKLKKLNCDSQFVAAGGEKARPTRACRILFTGYRKKPIVLLPM